MNHARTRTPGNNHGRPARLVCPKGYRAAPGIEPNAREASQMQRIAEGRPLPDRSHRSIRRKGRPSSACTGRNINAPGVATLAPAFTNGLPTLDGMPISYSHELHAELLYELCAALVREGLAGPETWSKCEGSAECARSRVHSRSP